MLEELKVVYSGDSKGVSRTGGMMRRKAKGVRL
jgi:hypothetical protein